MSDGEAAGAEQDFLKDAVVQCLTPHERVAKRHKTADDLFGEML